MSETTALAGRFKRGLWLSLLNTLLSRLGTFVLGIVLARLLVPEEFGLYATALVVLTLLFTFSDLGAATAVVRRPGDVRAMLPTAWTVSVVGSTIAFLVCAVSAPWLASALGSPHATDIVRFLAINVLLDGFAAVPAGMLTRELAQARRLVADLSGSVLNLALTATLAFLGYGAWALVIGHVSGTALVVVLLLVLSKQWPRFGFVKEHFLEVGAYGLSVIASSLLLMLAQSVPQMVTASALGVTALGFFYLANNVANWPVSIVSGTMERVALAMFSRSRDHGADLDRAAGGVIGLVGVAVLPGGIALALLAHPIVEVVYGARWEPAAAVLVGLAVAAIGRVFVDLAMHLLLAVGVPLSSALIQLSWLAALVPATIVAAQVWGLPGIGWAQAAVSLFVAVPVHVWGLRRAGVHVSSLVRGMVPSLLSAAVTGGGLILVRAFSPSPLLSVAVGGTLTAAVVAIGWFRYRHTLDEALAVAG
ncbi:oligosaccharide flippase family protein [Allokutzneria sp. A3M-2-11 16]|uniref:oligosaccharide flippase family protein n=1 Tax=Allokutzneria sp. A3M-2-11 16 TaxID=2962043 RepID=UPI0020B6DA33|nr:oligosaccharide flippase family protein [Allokutzneria sp. A3M-2-11 16]MCP3801113.1 oligosaccharide flippase family protein [Allokutzneria sp. A3M-2-11 16]